MNFCLLHRNKQNSALFYSLLKDFCNSDAHLDKLIMRCWNQKDDLQIFFILCVFENCMFSLLFYVENTVDKIFGHGKNVVYQPPFHTRK